MESVYIVEQRLLNFCECKVAAMMQNGRLYRDEDNGKLWHSPKVLSLQEFEDAYHFESKDIVEVNDDLAIELELAKPYWSFMSAYSKEVISPKDNLRVTKVNLMC